uniref:Titin n=1 Tax=Denticeps clupeoides TaxID=299321 RepID=A0AAY4B634_9TELE
IWYHLQYQGHPVVLLICFEYEFRVKCENIGGESDWSEVSEPIIPKSDTAPRAPLFKEELRDMTVKYKANATFVCKVVGHPKPVVKWYRSGKEILPDGEKIKVQEFKGGYYQLVISAADENDATVYQIRATNQEGSISTTVNLDIHLPDHLKGMGAVHAIRGEVVTIKIPCSGKPEPAITWQKGKDLIDNTAYHQVIVTRSFTSLVFLKGVQRKDAGYYIICAKNRFGMDKQTVELDVADIPDPPKDVKISDISRDSITLTWSPPANDGGSQIINYIVEKCPTSGDRWIRVAQTSEPQYTLINLFGKTKYQFRVIAENKFGLSDPSLPTEAVTTKEDTSIIRNYDEEVDEDREITKEEAPHSKLKNVPVQYQIAEEFARSGHFGIVHRCIEKVSKKTFMAKFIKVKGADRELVAREIETFNLARHKNILYLHESFDSLEEYVLIYEFISGVDIFERLGTANFDLTEQEIVRYMRQVCHALKFLHSLNYGHFDIRPDNIVYVTRRSTTVKIIEMGQARVLTPGDNLRIQFTAPEYYAPEIHRHDFVSTATDMWSVGVLAYVLLSGLNPFAAESKEKMIENISNVEYIFDGEAFKDVSVLAMDFVDRLLVKERKNRMTAAEALEHPWLKMKIENISNKVMKTLRHRRYYQSLVKKEWSTVVSGARIAYGGAFRNQRGITVERVKVATPEQGLRAGPILHGSAEEGGHVRFVCNLVNYDKNTEVTWFFGSRKLTASHKYEISYANGIASIYVKDIEESDDGLYRCQVVSQDAQENAYAELFVESGEFDITEE